MIVALSAGRDAPSELRSRLALDEIGQASLLAAPRPGVGELVVISTCHRTEIYATGDGLDADVVHAVAAVMPGLLPTDHHDMRFLQGAEAIEHLFRVASGLDSLVIGESQVLGQVRRAFVMAQKAGTAGPVLSNIFGRAIRVGRNVRAETPLGRLGESIGSIAAEYLAERFGGLKGRRAVVIGAGEAAWDAAKSLWKAQAEVSVVDRTPAAAERLAVQVDGQAFGMEDLAEVLSRAEFAVVAVSGGKLLQPSHFPVRSLDANAGPFLLLDLSVPSAVDITGRQDIEIRTLEEIPGPRGPEITDAVIDAGAMIKKEVADLLHWADTRAAGPVIRDLHMFGEMVVAEEIERVASSWKLSPDEQQRIESLIIRVVNKILHGPSTELRRADEATRAVIARMFNLDA